MPTKPKTTEKAEPKTRKRKANDPAQYERFREFAREVEAGDDREKFDRSFRKLVRPKS